MADFAVGAGDHRIACQAAFLEGLEQPGLSGPAGMGGIKRGGEKLGHLAGGIRREEGRQVFVGGGGRLVDLDLL